MRYFRALRVDQITFLLIMVRLLVENGGGKLRLEVIGQLSINNMYPLINYLSRFQIMELQHKDSKKSH